MTNKTLANAAKIRRLENIIQETQILPENPIRNKAIQRRLKIIKHIKDNIRRNMAWKEIWQIK